MNEQDEVVREFIVESYENLERIEQELLALESDPSQSSSITAIFRAIHTIKGTAGFFAFTKLESLAHAGENLLVKLRDGVMQCTPPIARALLETVDAVRQMLQTIEATGADEGIETGDLVHTLHALTNGEAGATTPAAPAAAQPPAPPPLVDDHPIPLPIPEPPKATPAAPKASSAAPQLGEVLLQQGLVQPQVLAQALKVQAEAPPPKPKLGEILVEKGAIQEQDIQKALSQQQEAAKASAADASIRVDVALLDRLMNLVGELVLARNQILQYSYTLTDPTVISATQRLNQLTSELQEGMMKTRMQPISNVWSKFPRVIRDLAQSCGKKINLEMEGKETELDKTIIEAIKDPLTHAIRNAADHGIESPEARVAKGKKPDGTVLLRAYHEGGQVNIEISDDGAGIDPEKVKAKALQKGLITADQAMRMSERELIHLIFAPGFSTASAVTNVSGRGVGMDVVKTNIERIGGQIDVQSVVNKGSTLKMKIPLTLAIIPALVIRAGEASYAIPQVNLMELIRLGEGDNSEQLEYLHGTPIYRLRGHLLPIVFLEKVLGGQAQPQEGLDTSIVVLQAGAQLFGLVVQGIQDTEEIVVKPLGKLLKGIPIYAGATIMGDGRVALILDVVGIAHAAGLLDAHGPGRREPSQHRAARSAQLQTLLLFGMPGGARFAIPLSTVARLEDFPLNAIERVGSVQVIRYGKEILPLFQIVELLGGDASELVPEGRRTISVIVYRDGVRSVGLVVRQILDIIEQHLEIQSSHLRPGVLCTTVIQDRVTEILDIRWIIDSLYRRYGQDFGAAAGMM